jgi:REP element-mobilizing transposase RayT
MIRRCSNACVAMGARDRPGKSRAPISGLTEHPDCAVDGVARRGSNLPIRPIGSILRDRSTNRLRPQPWPALPRFVLPGYPQHVIQRGNNQERILYEEDDYWFMWEKIGAAAEKFECDLHAYVLMPNHFHLVLTPRSENGVGKLMQYVGRYYVQHFNARYERTGTLWEGRYRATLLDPKQYLLPVCHYVEANPVRAGLVKNIGDYGWSSYGANAVGSTTTPWSRRTLNTNASGAVRRHAEPPMRGRPSAHGRGLGRPNSGCHQQGMGAGRRGLLSGDRDAAQSARIAAPTRRRPTLRRLSKCHGQRMRPTTGLIHRPRAKRTNSSRRKAAISSKPGIAPTIRRCPLHGPGSSPGHDTPSSARGIVERYLILSGQGRVEVEGVPPRAVGRAISSISRPIRAKESPTRAKATSSSGCLHAAFRARGLRGHRDPEAPD